MHHERACYSQLHESEMARRMMFEQDMLSLEGLIEHCENEAMSLEHSAEMRQASSASHESSRSQARLAPNRTASASNGMT